MTLGKRKSATGSTSRVDFGAFIDDFRPSCCKKSRFVKKSTLKGDTSFHEIPTTVGARVPVPGPRPGFFFFTLWGFFLYLGFSAFKSTAKRERERDRESRGGRDRNGLPRRLRPSVVSVWSFCSFSFIFFGCVVSAGRHTEMEILGDF